MQYPLAVRGSAIVLFAIGGTTVAMGLSAALGDATWSLSTGLGSCLIAGIYEVGRPERLSVEQADQLDEQYSDFGEPAAATLSACMFSQHSQLSLAASTCDLSGIFTFLSTATDTLTTTTSVNGNQDR